MCHLQSLDMVIWCVCCRSGDRGHFWTCYCNSHCRHWRFNSITTHLRKDHWLHWGSTVPAICCGHRPGILLIGCIHQRQHTCKPCTGFGGVSHLLEAVSLLLVMITAKLSFHLMLIISVLLTILCYFLQSLCQQGCSFTETW